MINVYKMPRRIINSKGIYEFISLIWSTYKNKINETIYLDFKVTKLIEPNIMAPLGLILTKLKSSKNNIVFINLSIAVKNVLIDNGFILSKLAKENSISQNYICYKSFSGNDNDGFREYILEQLNEIKDLETINLLISRIMELFVNVKMHARYKITRNRFGNKEIFSSGAYYKEDNYLIFSIANNGLTFADNIKSSIDFEFSKEYEYIKWALQKSNTTRETKSEGPGGLGLFLLVDLIREFKGKILITSGNGFYRYDGDRDVEHKYDIECAFPGTVITIKLPIKHISNEDEFNYSIELDVADLLREVI